MVTALPFTLLFLHSLYNIITSSMDWLRIKDERGGNNHKIVIGQKPEIYKQNYTHHN